MLIDYELATDFDIIDQVRARYATELAALKRLGFRELCFYSEIIIPFSAILFLPSLLMMCRRREVLSIRRPLRISASYPLLVSPAHATTALVLGLGVKFYTLFADSSGLITANFNSVSGQDLDGTFVKYATPGSIEQIWQQHSERLTELQALGRQLRVTATFEDYVALSRREEEMLTGLPRQQLEEAASPMPANTRVFWLLVILLGVIGLLSIVLLLLIVSRVRD